MRQILGIFFLVIQVLILIYELSDASFDSGYQAVLVIGMTLIGIYLSLFAITAVTKK